MRAMILAAGLGTRLRPLTDHRPKALVELGGRTLLEITLIRLRAFGIQDVIINVHHFAPMVEQYLTAKQNFGMHIEISREEVLLDTGGGLKQAAHFFLQNTCPSDEPFLVHNVDVISTIDFAAMTGFHAQSGALATLAVQARPTSRYLLFDQQSRLRGRRAAGNREDEIVRPSDSMQAMAFCGVHVVSPRIFPKMTEDGIFSIIDCYLRLASTEKILSFAADPYLWRDVGTVKRLSEAAHEVGRLDLPHSF